MNLFIILYFISLINELFACGHNCWKNNQEQQTCDFIYGVNCWLGYTDKSFSWFYNCYCCNGYQKDLDDGVVSWQNDRLTFYREYISEYPNLLESCVPPGPYSLPVLQCIKYDTAYCNK